MPVLPVWWLLSSVTWQGSVWLGCCIYASFPWWYASGYNYNSSVWLSVMQLLIICGFGWSCDHQGFLLAYILVCIHFKYCCCLWIQLLTKYWWLLLLVKAILVAAWMIWCPWLHLCEIFLLLVLVSEALLPVSDKQTWSTWCSSDPVHHVQYLDGNQHVLAPHVCLNSLEWW